jgi:hypothetical protein
MQTFGGYRRLTQNEVKTGPFGARRFRNQQYRFLKTSDAPKAMINSGQRISQMSP